MGKVMQALFFAALLLCPALAFAQSHSVTISWTPSTQPNSVTIASWNLLRGAISGGPYTQIANIPVGTTSYTDTSVSSGSTYYYVVQAVDTAGTVSADSAQAEVVIPTSAPPLAVATTSLPAAIAGTSYSVTITASGGVGPYTWSGTGVDGLTFSGTGLLSGTPSQAGTFTQNVTVKDSTGTTASASLSLSVTALTLGSSLSFVQVNSAVPQGQSTQVAVTYSKAQTAGNLNVVVVGWNDSTAQVSSVTDSKGNAYALAVGPTVQSGTASQAIYYAKNIVAATAGGNTVTVVFNTGANSAGYSDCRVQRGGSGQCGGCGGNCTGLWHSEQQRFGDHGECQRFAGGGEPGAADHDGPGQWVYQPGDYQSRRGHIGR